MDPSEAASALAVWVALGAEGLEGSLERNYTYGSAQRSAEYHGKPRIFHRVGVRMRPLSAEEVDQAASIATRYGGKVSFTTRATSEPWLEITW